jgi:hypothetical protein
MIEGLDKLATYSSHRLNYFLFPEEIHMCFPLNDIGDGFVGEVSLLNWNGGFYFVQPWEGMKRKVETEEGRKGERRDRRKEEREVPKTNSLPF